jgi:hypothetical protein
MVTPGEGENGGEERESRRERRRAKRDAKREEQTEERVPPPQPSRRPEPDDDRGLVAWGPRILAPLAFFLAATILILLVSSALDHKKKESTTTVPTTSTPAGTPGTSTGEFTPKAKRKFYVIKEGDTLESIAAKKNTTLDDLLTLNPGIDPTTLTPGKKIRIS